MVYRDKATIKPNRKESFIAFFEKKVGGKFGGSWISLYICNIKQKQTLSDAPQGPKWGPRGGKRIKK